MNMPTQAAILCGGLGSRLKPLTDTLPKPMAPINGVPFLAFLIAQLRDQGVGRFVLMTGYLGEKVSDYFGDGSAMGVEIVYSHGPVDWDTGRRIWEARPHLDPRFLLLYSDNYVPFSLAKLMALHMARQSVISLLVTPKAPGNIRMEADGKVAVYDSGRSAELDRVEIGYMVVERDAMFAAYDAPDVSFSRILRKLAGEGKLAGLTVTDPYHSIGDIERWKLTERYLTPRKLLLIDRDGTINQKAPRGEYVVDWANFRWVEENVQAMESLARAGFQFIILSNQAGIGRGVVSAAAVEDLNRRMVEALAGRGIDILAVYVCPHHWEDKCSCRKPATGLFDQAAREHLVRMDRTMYIGDDPRDARAADNAQCLSVLVGDERNIDPGGGVRPTRAAANLSELVPWIIAQFDQWAAK